VRRTSGLRPGTGTAIGASGSSAAWAPAFRPGVSIETAVSGIFAGFDEFTSGRIKRGHANFDGGAANRYRPLPGGFPCPGIKRPIIEVRKLIEDRYSSGPNKRLPGNADATDVRSAAPIRATRVKRAYEPGPVTTRAAGLG
jgi:hypothetical protein